MSEREHRVMGLHRRPEDRLLEGRELPRALADRFKTWGISRQEQDSFRDRMWATGITKDELAALAAAPNPWAELSRLEERPRPPSQGQTRPHKDSAAAENTDESLAPDGYFEEAPQLDPASAPAPLRGAILPPRSRSNPYAERIRDLCDQDFFEFHDNFIKLYHLDSPYAVPQAMLQDSKLLIYEALIAELACRKRPE